MLPNIRDDFKKKVSKLEDYITLVVANAKNYEILSEEILKYLLLVDKIPGVYITLNKPYDIILRKFKDKKIDNRLIIFIDGITNVSQSNKTKIQNCLFINTPEKLSDLFVALDQAVNAITVKNKFIFLDSLNTLTLFNTETIIARFAHQLIAKMRAWKIKGVILSIEGTHDQLITELTPFCDIRFQTPTK